MISKGSYFNTTLDGEKARELALKFLATTLRQSYIDHPNLPATERLKMSMDTAIGRLIQYCVDHNLSIYGQVRALIHKDPDPFILGINAARNINSGSPIMNELLRRLEKQTSKELNRTVRFRKDEREVDYIKA